MSVPSAQTLVQGVIDHFRLHREKLGGAPLPIDPATLERLTFPDGKPLPPSLKLWLSFDSRSLGLFSDLNKLIIPPVSLADTMGAAFGTIQRLLLPDPAYFLYPQNSNESWWFLYAGQADAEGEYPVFLADIDDRYSVQVVAPNFGVWLADYHRRLDFDLHRWRENPELAALMRHQSRLNFHGYRYCEVFGEAVTADGDAAQWCSEAELIADLKGAGFDDRTINAMLGKDTSGY